MYTCGQFYNVVLAHWIHLLSCLLNLILLLLSLLCSALCVNVNQLLLTYY
jgi:hypothetical protein